jgi:proline racemase
MRWSKTLHVIEVHAEGEPGSVIAGGVFDVPGLTILERFDHLRLVDDSIRRFCVYEPRGRAQMSMNLVFAPSHPDADAAFLIMQADGVHAMSGSNTICVATALLETGALPMREPQTRLVFETPAGLIAVTASCRDGKCESVTLDGSASFVEQLDVAVDVPGIGRVVCDIAFGGCYYGIVDARQLGLSVTADDARRLVDAATVIHGVLRERVSVRHPEIPSIDHISYMFVTDRDADDPRILRGACVLPPGRVDRSPCGTGNSARMAVMRARGEVSVGDVFDARSVIDSSFQVEMIGETTVAGRPAVLPRITGRGWIYGMQQLGVDPTDPYPLGFTLSDTWGNDLAVTR